MGISVFLKGPRDRINQTFCLSAIALVLWIVFDSTSVIYWNQIEVRTILTRLASAAGILAAGAIACFCIVFSRKKATPYKLLAFVSCITVIFAVLALLPGVVFKEFRIEGSHVTPINGPLRAPLYVIEALLFLLGLGHLLRRYRLALLDQERFQLKLLGIGILIPASVTIIAFSVLPSLLTDSPALASVGPLSTIIFVLLAGYAISGHGLFTVDVALEHLFNNITIGLCVTQTDGRIVRCNQTLLNMLECERKFSGHPIEDLIDFLESKSGAEAVSIHHWFENRQPEPLQIAISGTGVKSLEVTAHCLTNRHGKPVGSVYLFSDITACKQAEEALRQSEETVRALLNAPTDSGILIDTEGTMLAINQTGAQRLGRGMDELVGVNCYSLFPPDLANSRKSWVDQAIQTGKVLRFEDRRGEVVFDNTVYPIFDQNGKVVQLAIYGRDITEQQRTYENLRQSEEHFRALIENALDAIGVVAFDGTIRYESPSAERVLGYKPEEMVGTSAFDHVHPKHRQRIIREFTEMVQNPGEVEFEEFPYLHKDGSWRTIEVSAKKLPEENSVVINYRDITDRKKTEEALRESEKRYRTLAETVTDMIWTLDAKSLRFTYVSPSVQTMFGYTVQEAIAKPLDQILTADSFDFAMNALAEALALGEKEQQDHLVGSRLLELEHIRKDGSTVWAEVTTSFLRDQDGRLTEILGVTRDITTRRQRMEKLRAMSLVDELTGLYNRRGFLTLSQQQLKVAYRTRRSMAVLFIDFDDLKRVNDTLGHEEGNIALIETADILKDTFRESDIIARIGGDEFAILAVEVPHDSIEILCNRLREKIETHNVRSNTSRKLSISVGMSRYNPEFPCTIEELLTQADKLMYEEKRRKKELQPDPFGAY